MSGRIVGEVLENAPEDLTPAELLTLIALAEDAHDKTRHAAYSDVATLARKIRRPPGTVRNALSELTRRGLIVPTRTGGVGRGKYHQEYDLVRLHPHHRETTRKDTA